MSDSILLRRSLAVALSLYMLPRAEGAPVVEPIDSVLPAYVPAERRVRNPLPEDDHPPMRLLLSRERYWQQDGHLDLLVQLAAGEDRALADTTIEWRLVDAQGTALNSIESIAVPAERFMVYPILPPAFLGEARIDVRWQADGQTIAEQTQAFRVEAYDKPVPRAGRISLVLANPAGVVQPALPVTVGVPFPRGILASAADLRLVDGQGADIPLQVRETARWSKFGSLKWVLCDFTVDLDGEPRELFLEYGRREEARLAVGGGQLADAGNRASSPAPDERRWTSMDVDSAHPGFPALDAGRLRFGPDGLWFDAAGNGNFKQVLEAGGLSGAFVEHEDGRVYRPDPATPFVIEESGPEKLVIRREGWYVSVGSGQWAEGSGQRTDAAHRAAATAPDSRFCRYITRFVIHRGSPLVRIFHTWVFTGDSNRDRIRNMGWQFRLSEAWAGGDFLTGFGPEGEWLPGDFLLQYDYEHGLVSGPESVRHLPGMRSPGAARAAGQGVELYFGAKDFWQHYPSELEFRDGALWFHNWPRHNLPAAHTFDKIWEEDHGEPAASASAARYALEAPDRLTRSEWVLNVLQHRYAHEGEVLDFRLPDRFAEPPLSWQGEHPYANEISNAQGISHTEEMWLLLRPADEAQPSEPVLEGLDRETLRAVVDPAWVALTDVFLDLSPCDTERFPDEEHSYELAALSPTVMAERLGSYGMWIYGDNPAWQPRLQLKAPDLYRAFQKQHLGWPYSWIPFARSGDSRLLKIAEANTRRILDAAYCHYVDTDRFGDTRRLGHWGVGAVYWGGKTPAIRGTFSAVDFLLEAWHLTGYHRAWDHARLIGELFKLHPLDTTQFGRVTNAQLKTYLDLYEVTWDPWFLAAAHALSQGHMHGRTSEFRDGIYGGRQWNTGDRDFLHFTGCRVYRDELYLGRHVPRALDEWEPTHYNRRHPQYPDKVYAWRLTGDPYFLGRAVNAVQSGTAYIGDGSRYPDYLQGYVHINNDLSPLTGGSTVYTIFTGYHLRWFPIGLRVLHDVPAAELAAPIPNTFLLRPPRIAADDGFDRRLTLTFRKEQPGVEIPLRLRAWRFGGMAPDRDDIEVDYRVFDSAGREHLAGTWSYAEGRRYPADINRKDVLLPAEAPPGDYRLNLRFGAAGTVAFPVTPWDVPEVLVWDFESGIPGASTGVYWFKVPEGVERFWIDFWMFSKRGLTMIWAPDGRRMWNYGDHYPESMEATPRGPIRAEIDVPPGQDGQFWRISSPGTFRLDPVIPPIVAASPGRWFEPVPVEEP